MRQLQLFTTAQLAVMRDRTKARNYSAEADAFRREHERHRAWGLTQRHARKLRRLRDGTPSGQAPSVTRQHRNDNRPDPSRCRPPQTGTHERARDQAGVETPTSPDPALHPHPRPRNQPPGTSPYPRKRTARTGGQSGARTGGQSGARTSGQSGARTSGQSGAFDVQADTARTSGRHTARPGGTGVSQAGQAEPGPARGKEGPESS